ncbi:MAG: ribonuclease III [Planctomycetota bacterium]
MASTKPMAAKGTATKKGESAATILHDRTKLLNDVQELIDYQFKNPGLLISALTHASSADSRVVSNERLEFLGDSVLGLVICEQLYRLFPDLLEGELTKIKSVVVSRRTCARISRTIGLEKFLILGRGMSTQSVIPSSVVSAAFESLIAAIYLDGGLEPARAFILQHTLPEIEKSANGHHGGNYKSLLQQMSQKEFGAIPTYEMVEEQGPDHSKSFKVLAVIGDLRYPPAWGQNKKEAQQRAALNALSQINGLEIPYPCE